jgi:glycosyltransferase involved in cell wall biosynthesis
VAGDAPQPTYAVALISDTLLDTAEKTGIGRYDRRLRGGLSDGGLRVVQDAPKAPALPSVGYQLLRVLRRNKYPIWSSYPDADLYHLTSQDLASLLVFRRPKGAVVVTVHDIFAYMLRHRPDLLSFGPGDRVWVHLAATGLKRADHLIAVSDYSKSCLVRHLRIPPEKITVVHLGVDNDHFRPQSVAAGVRERYSLPEGPRYLLYVGREDRRKNLSTLIRTLATVRRAIPTVELIKVGRPHQDAERAGLSELAARLGVQEAIHFLGDVPEHDLPQLYNLADAFVTPSLYEGFGLPVLEAMACGTPVVCPAAGSLPEIAGEAAVQVPPSDVDGLADALVTVLASPENRARLRRAGIRRARTFGWDATIRKTEEVYGRLLGRVA